MPRPAAIHHCTSQPLRFFGRQQELNLLDEALAGGALSLVAMVGPGGQGKTAIVQHWLQSRVPQPDIDGIFLWSFYRGKDSDLCLRNLLAYAIDADQIPDVSASYCVDRLLPILRRERWALVFDGAEIVQHETGSWFGRFVHPELGRLLDELASEPLPGVVAITSRFPLPTLENRRHARILSLETLDAASAVHLLQSFGVSGSADELHDAAVSAGLHAKAVELLGTFLLRFSAGQASWQRHLPAATTTDVEACVGRVLRAFHDHLPTETKDILALATAFRSPPTETQLLQFLASAPVQRLLVQTWERTYLPFDRRPKEWLAQQVQELVELRLLERVGLDLTSATGPRVIDAHPLVRRGFEDALGAAGQMHNAAARAGFLRNRPDRRPPQSLAEAREEVELFHAYCDAGLWNEADGVYVALNNPKHRFLAPAFERDLLLRFFPENDWQRPPHWSGFGRYRSLAMCFELLGQFAEALDVYRPDDAPLGGDALIALGRLEPILQRPQANSPWQALWQSYRCHALCLAGLVDDAVSLAQTLVPVDVYEWVHVFECLLRAGRLASLDLNSLLYRTPLTSEHRWSSLARRRMRADYLRVTATSTIDLDVEYRELVEAYDQGGLPFERALTRLGLARHLIATRRSDEARSVIQAISDLADRYHMPIMAADAWETLAAISEKESDAGANASRLRAKYMRAQFKHNGPVRP